MLRHLIAEAAALAGGNLCAAGYDWSAVGGRPCPRGMPMASQPVYQCDRCGVYDYGEPGGPAHAECAGPCRWCVDAERAEGGA